MAEAPSSSVPRITYWRGRGRCEPTRCVLAASGVEFETGYILNRADYLALCESGKLLYNQIPLLEIDGLNIVQTRAQLNYLARKYGFVPESIKDQATVDMVCEGIRDARVGTMTFLFRGKDFKAYLDALPKIKERYLSKWEAMIIEDKGTFTSHGVTLAEIELWEMLTFMEEVFEFGEKSVSGAGSGGFASLMAEYPKLQSMMALVMKTGKISEWVERRNKELVDWDTYRDDVDSTLGR